LNEEEKVIWKVRDWKRLSSERVERRLTNRYRRLVKFPREAGIVPMREFEGRDLLNEEEKVIWKVRDWERLSSERREKIDEQILEIGQIPKRSWDRSIEKVRGQISVNEEGKIIWKVREIGRDWVLRE
jgi:hypothetical protein